MRDNNSIRVSRSLRDTAYKAIYAKENYMKKNQKEPTVQEIAEEIGISKEDIVFALDAIQVPYEAFRNRCGNDGGDALYVMDQLSDQTNKEEKVDKEDLSLEEAMKRRIWERTVYYKASVFSGKNTDGGCR